MRQKLLSELCLAITLAAIFLLGPQNAFAQSATIDLAEIEQISNVSIRDILFDNNKLYTIQADSETSATGALVIYDASTPSHLAELGRLPLSDVGPLAVNNGTVYVSASSLIVIDAANPAAPTQLSTFNPFDSIVGRPLVVNDLLHVGYSKTVDATNNPNCLGDTRTEYGLLTISVNNGRDPQLIGQVASPRAPFSPARCEQHARPVEIFQVRALNQNDANTLVVLTSGNIAQRESSIQGWWNVSVLNPQQPVSGNILNRGGNRLGHGFVDGDFLYTTAPSFGVGVYWGPSFLSKRTRISALPEVGVLFNCPSSYTNTCIPNNLPSFGDLVISNNTIFVATTDGIRIFGASGADELDELNRTSFGNAGSLLTVGNGVIFMGNNSGGIKVLEIDEGTEPPIGGNNARVYGDNLASGWHAGTLGSISYNLSNTDPVDEGSRSISASFDGPWSALFLESTPPVDSSTVTGLRFSVYGTQAHQTLRVKTMSSIWEQSAGRTIKLEPNQWQQVTLTKEELGNATDYRYLLFENPKDASQPIFYLDDITLLGGGGGSANHPPVLVNPGNQSSFKGEMVSLSIQASDPDNDALSYSASNLPTGMSLNSVSGLISGATLAPGFTNVSITVSDGQDSAVVEFGWTVSEDTPPVGGSALSIYTDSISEDWSTGAWGSTTIDRGNQTTVIEGDKSLAVTYNEQWATLYFRAQEPLNELNYSSLYFQVYATAENQEIKVQIMDSNLKTSEGFYVIRPQANTWSTVSIPLHVFREIDGIYYITLHNPRSSGQPTFYLDDVKLTRVPGVESDGVYAAGIDYSAIEYGSNGLPARFRFNPNSGQVESDPQPKQIFLPFTSGYTHSID